MLAGNGVNAIVPAEVMAPLYQRLISNFPNLEEKLATINSKMRLGERMT